MEVDVNKDFKVGTEWTAMTETSYQGRQGAAGGGYSGEFAPGNPGYSNLKGIAAGTLPAGFSLGVFTEALQIGGVTFPSLNAVVQAYQKDKDVNILSTPQILTTDNEEATITVGKNIPYQTRSAAETGVETYSSYEYKDVGITLKITPQISEERLVRLNIFQEISKLDELSTTNADRPTTLKRTIETTVIVQDGHTIVIGGLIEDISNQNDYKVPCLGEIPLLGWLFRSYHWSGEKTNLFIFLSPKVVKYPVEAEIIHREKKDLIDKIKEGKIKMYE
jgi:general secretion pathway protein D